MVAVEFEGREIKPYPQADKPDQVHGKLFGKFLLSRFFVNPETGQIEEFGLIGQKDWSAALAVTTDRKVLLVRQYKQGVGKIVDECPAGTADWKTESPEAVMRRELRFETGHEVGTLIRLGSHPIASRGSPTHFHTFVAFDCLLQAPPNFDKKEPIQYAAVDMADFVRMIHNGQINEPSAICAFDLALPHLLVRGLVTREMLIEAAGL